MSLDIDNNELNPMSEQIFFKKGDHVTQPDGEWQAKVNITMRIWEELQGCSFNLAQFTKYFERVG